MRINRAAVLTAACATGLLGLPAPFAAATAAEPAVLHVDNSDPAACSDGGAGSAAQPFCTVQAGVDHAGPGQTVLVAAGTHYDAPLSVTRSGEPGRPITVRGERRSAYPVGQPVLDTPDDVPSLTVRGVHDVVVGDLILGHDTVVSGSDRVTLDRLDALGTSVRVTGAGSGVTVSRSTVDDLVVEAGSTGARLLRNRASGIRVTDATGTVLTNNSVTSTCAPAVAVTGSSTGTGLYNNVLRQVKQRVPCADPAGAVGVRVDAPSAAGTVFDSDLVSVDGGTAYSWAGSSFRTPEELAAAAGAPSVAGERVKTGYNEDDALDSADAGAPGALEPDPYDGLAADAPYAANTGTGSPAYLDRGAFERQDPVQPGPVSLALNYLQAPYGTDIVATATDSGAGTRWPSTAVTYSFDFGDGTVVDTADRVAHHTYAAACSCQVKVTVSDGIAVHTPQSSQPTYLAVTAPGALAARTSVVPLLPTSSNPIGWTPPLSMTVDNGGTSAPWPVVSTVVDYGDGKQESFEGLSSPSHQYAAPGDYTVRTTVKDSKGATSSTSAQAHVAYAASGFLTTEPHRLLDTRTDPYVALRGGTPLVLNVPVGTAARPVTSGGVASVVLNVTVTGASEDSHLTVWPVGQPRPATSNVNVAAGKTSSNLVTVPLGLQDSLNAVLNSGQAEVVVDVLGYYQPNAGDRFSPLAPARLLDTRSSGGALRADSTRNVKVAGVGGVPADATSVVLNLTSTGTTEDTYLTVWPHGSARPGSSNLNPEPGKDKSNQVIVPVGPDGTVDLYNHGGSTDAVIDVFGYYGPGGGSLFTPVVPRRLADTRPGSLGQDAVTGVAVGGANGVPAGATAAALNVTATGATDSTHLVVFPDGTARPGTSSLNLGPRQTVPNHVITPLGANGRADVYNHTGSVQVVVDLFGYYTKG